MGIRMRANKPVKCTVDAVNAFGGDIYKSTTAVAEAIILAKHFGEKHPITFWMEQKTAFDNMKCVDEFTNYRFDQGDLET